MIIPESTIGAAFFSQTVAVNDATVKFEIWDTAGQERYHSLAPMYYRGAAAAIIVYDITNQNSSVMTIGIIAPVCCVQFHSKSRICLPLVVQTTIHTACIFKILNKHGVFAYHRSFSMPITSHKFSLADDDDGRFVSAVCSQKQSEMLVAANSVGSIKLLHMV
ncbi:hypothetical protein DCAR_0417626 [Daucus carota subsp. sativus]|uniref:Uncharacterized protein n=2 Tax=Daucus carota subsp. sativus TaxID=79200 RepID=A0A166AM24_DAUCS|nr:hypothetical protein DCAR_0417626 [Daucus carota subsp. sativus]